MIDKLKIHAITQISAPAPHAAFTDLCADPFDTSAPSLFCTYREADTHVSPNGKIIVVHINRNTLQPMHSVAIEISGTDLRDPKFSFDGERLIITAYAKTVLDDGSLSRRMVSYSSDKGLSWSEPHHFGDDTWWIWNCDWFKKTAYGFAYNRKAEFISLYKGNPLQSMELYQKNVFGLEKSGKGYPNESALLFDKRGNAFVFLRRDADTFSAQFGHSTPPYLNWEWHDLGIYIGGPAAVFLGEGKFLVSGRHVDWETRSFSTRIWHFDVKLKKLTELITLPSGGDTSYPGLVLNDDILYVSYYSSHCDEEARVYLAKLSGVSALQNSKT
ncbi:hypothetical protein ACOJR9_05010 [Alteromonas sp. A081]|uniref:hypothetical protein n=1 Tax=Alteromonas sp. A081 TaxID=3410269 RepID=UPI003B97FFF3